MQKKELQEEVTGDYVYPLFFIHWRSKKPVYRKNGGRFKFRRY